MLRSRNPCKQLTIVIRHVNGAGLHELPEFEVGAADEVPEGEEGAVAADVVRVVEPG